MNLEKDEKEMSMDEKKELWIKAWISLVQTDGLQHARDVSDWADRCVKDCEDRFYKRTVDI